MDRETFVAGLDPGRRAEFEQLDAVVRAAAPQWEPFYNAGTAGYGTYRYRYPSGQTGEWFRVGISLSKASISVHVVAAEGNGYLTETRAADFPKASVGRSCVRFKRLADVSLEAIGRLIGESTSRRAPGEVD